MDIGELEKLSTSEIEDRLDKLPVGYISKKIIKGREYCYYQWRENDKVKSRYLKKNEIEPLIIEIEERKGLQKILKERAQQERVKAYASAIGYLGNDVAIGVQDFARIVERKSFYVDKTKFIMDWWARPDIITLINRPRRFGKTLNMSMLYYFFSNMQADSKLFDDLYIGNFGEYMKIQGTYPVIFISFAGVKFGNSGSAFSAFDYLFWNLYSKFAYIFNSDFVTKDERAYYEVICGRKDPDHGANALNFLSGILYRYYNKRVIILLDEYDTPLIEVFSEGGGMKC